ncbi:MAG: DUF3365 domain-containing protein [Candidatus Zixiibacteriota bacterium]|nr:MAG: DUF3365 domain-containing protein [candidate division Zixibacteria bacterium]
MRKILIFALSFMLLAGCGKKSDRKEPSSTTSTSEAQDQQLLAEASDILIQTFSNDLRSELLAALNEGGPANAITVCEIRAPEIAAAHSGEFWTVRRVTDRSRNPENAASDAEKGLLARFRDTAQSPPEYIIGWAPSEEGKTYRHYRPIRVAQLCLKCHGRPDDIDDAAEAVLAEKYPSDRAIGYAEGDLRGMFVVELHWPEGKAFVDSLVAASKETEIK